MADKAEPEQIARVEAGRISTSSPDAHQAEMNEIRARHARGLFTMLEAAEILAAANGLDAKHFLETRMRPAAELSELRLMDPRDGGPVVGRPIRDFHDWLTATEMNRWLEAAGFSYRWPAIPYRSLYGEEIPAPTFSRLQEWARRADSLYGRSRVTVDEALAYVWEHGDFRGGGMVDIFAGDDGRDIQAKLRDGKELAGATLGKDFENYCRAHDVRPSNPVGRWTSDYSDDAIKNATYEITIEQLRKFAEAYGIDIEDSKGAQSDPASRRDAAALDFSVLATREDLIKAFGSRTGMSESWFKNLTDSPRLLEARKATGRGSRNSAEPYFCPFQVMQWLISPKRKRGTELDPATGWRLLEQHFPKVYNSRSVGDPRDV